MKVKVYWDSVRRQYSIVDKATGLVCKRTKDSFLLVSARLTVGQAARKRVLAENKKNLHAFLHGELYEDCTRASEHAWVGVTYNPRRDETWVRRKDGTPIDSAEILLCSVDPFTGAPSVWAPTEER